ncbi:hypothetical protein [Cyanobacterium aponinum]|uniref:hypothetical protein n=1 Tax=Cyanobacterium aponinum TaxID=379064 RepID=UPI0018ACEC73|nr:hypothetical protein [Cyanobacterium aponinum]
MNLVKQLKVDYPMIAVIAQNSGAMEFYWRESDRSYTGYVAEVWFQQLPSEFAYLWSQAIGESILVRKVSEMNSYCVSIPCNVPDGSLKMRSKNKKVRLVIEGEQELINSYYPALS